ncbi:MAG: hypothetical protein VX938_00210, partial [Myxococcota bacterium]|nr:hypothetical protein [Myxococcota bacterium]
MIEGTLWRRQTALTVLSLVSLVVLSLIPAQASVPLQIPVQGLLRDNAGVPVAEDVFQVTFALYGEPEGGDPIWSETWPPEGGDCLGDPTGCVHVVRGTFQVMLGAHTAL